jgi:hypothetical protein
MRVPSPILLLAFLTGCASLLNGGDPGMEIIRPFRSHGFREREPTGYHTVQLCYDPADGREVMFELRKNSYKPTTFSMRPKMDNGVLFADAMLLGIPYIVDRKSPALYEMPTSSSIRPTCTRRCPPMCSGNWSRSVR